jgi:hypothetical protein
MKIIITESQFSRLVSKVTEMEPENSFLTKLVSVINKDQEVGKMVLKAVQEGNYDIDDKVLHFIKFNINGFPFVIEKSILGRGKKYEMTLPYLSNHKLSISDNLLKKIYHIIAKEHMDIKDYMVMHHMDSF